MAVRRADRGFESPVRQAEKRRAAISPAPLVLSLTYVRTLHLACPPSSCSEQPHTAESA